ncbi:hypothetical protein GP475_07890 [Corynebacterium poyangense]|uniref:SAV-6107-like HEPN domain-containing protein n=1 Tax=Corynebacterium poyangense TaxID=2684405 RepID=A0A7H0SPU4_9CORY|nr:SAV_6107 family HEPN domain-containing protein [Corynebacterium poyangense]QNQ90569.1 hypothetical protein GP475_07890 [Corynebacterium poyangense]
MSKSQQRRKIILGKDVEIVAQVISATTRFSQPWQGRSSFLSRAHFLLAQAIEQRAGGHYAQAFESAYQAALRVAGSRISQSAPKKRRAGTQDAWHKLALIDSQGEYWAQVFRSYRSQRQRLLAGAPDLRDSKVVDRLIEQVEQFLEEVENGGIYSSAA